MMAHTAGVDYYRILAGMKKDYPRAHDIPGAGFAAGPCLFKDTMQLVSYSGNRHSLGHYAMLINEGLPFYVVEQIAKRHDLKTCTIGLLGMAFKANIDDARASLSYKLKKVLKFKAKQVLMTDPFVQGDPELQPLQTVLKKSDVLILCTPHSVYKKIRGPHGEIFDPWNFLGKGFQIPASRAR
jgi:UDP-N-acetyl-D-mannosaminuronic acid dehydrogenase